MRFKKIITGILALCISFSLVIPSAAEASLTTNDKANILHELSILTGNGVDYDLDSQLKRCEAAAFIIRIMGKVDHVAANENEYSITSFDDVPSNSWYASYVGFCSQEGIISGYQSGKFEPNVSTSEKAFLKMLLVTLGYNYGTDFSWNNVYQMAYNTGLVTDTSYKTRTVDNTSYKRSGVVNVLYNALQIKNKLTNRTLIQDLIDTGAIDESIAISLGLVIDTVATAISQVNVLNENRVSVRFNESLANITLDKINIYETNDLTKKLTVEIATQSNSEIILKTSSQIPDKAYTIEISSVTDLEGNIYELLSSTFTGYRNAELKSDLFKISKVEVASKNILNIYFTHPINTNSEYTGYYSIEQNGNTIINGSSQSMAVKMLNSVSNGISIYLKDTTLTEGADYTLKVSGDLTSVYGVKLNNELGDSIIFKGIGTENSGLKIVTIDALSSNRISVEFNIEVDPGFAQKFLNYSVIGPNNVSITVSKAIIGGEGIKKGKTVVLSLMSAIDRTKQYELKIEYLPDIFRQSAIEEVKQSFSGAYPDKSSLAVEYAMALDKGTIQIYFNKQLDPSAAILPAYYMVTGVTNSSFVAVPSKVLYNESDKEYKALLYLPPDKYLNSSYSYKVRVLSSIPDYYGNSSSTNAEFTFGGSSTDVLKPAFSKAVIISNDTIRVEFNREIANDIVNIQPSNYWLEYSDGTSTLSKNPLFVAYIDSSNIVLKFDSLKQDTKYVLKFNMLKDFTGSITSTSSDGNNAIDVVMGK